MVSYTTVEQVVIGDAEFAEQVVHKILAGGGRAVMERGFTGGQVEQAVCRWLGLSESDSGRVGLE